MAGELWHIDGVAGAREALGEVAHFDRGATQTMDQQEPGAPSREACALVC